MVKFTKRSYWRSETHTKLSVIICVGVHINIFEKIYLARMLLNEKKIPQLNFWQKTTNWHLKIFFFSNVNLNFQGSLTCWTDSTFISRKFETCTYNDSIEADQQTNKRKKLVSFVSLFSSDQKQNTWHFNDACRWKLKYSLWILYHTKKETKIRNR